MIDAIISPQLINRLEILSLLLNSHNPLQGMHEILGIIIYAIHTETLKINQYPDANDLMKQIYDSQYLEHDA